MDGALRSVFSVCESRLALLKILWPSKSLSHCSAIRVCYALPSPPHHCNALNECGSKASLAQMCIGLRDITTFNAVMLVHLMYAGYECRPCENFFESAQSDDDHHHYASTLRAENLLHSIRNRQLTCHLINKRVYCRPKTRTCLQLDFINRVKSIATNHSRIIIYLY